jgi:hypothetical protein
MTLLFGFGNDAKVERIARELAKKLAISDISHAMWEELPPGEIARICTALDPEFGEREKELGEIKKKIEALGPEVASLWSEASLTQEYRLEIRQTAWFNLGFQAALRLMGTSPDFHVINGGATQRKREAI